MVEKIFIEKVPSLPKDIDPNLILNVNIGILGHIDSGKTSLAKNISTIASTASFDKNPQSQERGITLDLGFSAFYIKTPNFLKEKFPDNERLIISEYLQLTLVDCPGHASLLRTVIAGAAIIDLMVLVIDCVKGIQTQTTECLILGEILSDELVVAFNKVDLILNANITTTNKKEDNEKVLESKVNKLKQAFSNTKFGITNSVHICKVAADPKKYGENQQLLVDENDLKYYSSLTDSFISTMVDKINFSKRKDITNTKDFLLSIDHCFTIKNKGTIVTGTILKGKVQAGDDIYFPEICAKKTVKEIQMFKKPINKAYLGDRVGMLIKNLDHTTIERSLACTDNYVRNHEGGIFVFEKIKYFKFPIITGSKIFLIIGNQGVNAKLMFFNEPEIKVNKNSNTTNTNNYTSKDKNILYHINTPEINKISDLINNTDKNAMLVKSLYNKEFLHTDSIEYSSNSNSNLLYAYLKFDNKILIPEDSLCIGCKIDTDVSQKTNRIALHGKMIDNLSSSSSNSNSKSSSIPAIKIIKKKFKTGNILRMTNDYTAIVKDLFKKDSNISDFIGKEVRLELDASYTGIIQGEFGQSGKVKVDFQKNIKSLILKNDKGEDTKWEHFKIVLEYNKYIKLYD